MNCNAYVKSLVEYGLKQRLIAEEDRIYARNQILFHLGLSDYEEPEDAELITTGEGEAAGDSLEKILTGLLGYAREHGLISEDTVTKRDLFDTKLMNCLMPRPSEVIGRFEALYREQGPNRATDYFYKLSKDSDYIRRYRVKKDLRWKTDTQYGPLDITINLSKPEKDPRDIAAAKKMKQSGYPKCLLCVDNVGYAGRMDHPARDNHRIIPLQLDGEDWGFQYSPYVYYNEHCIVFCQKHTPMRISDATFCRLFDFVKRFPHYILGSNADLPIVGGSILTHDHFQGGSYEFPMARAEAEQFFSVPAEYPGVQAAIVRWPMSVLRLSGRDTGMLCRFASKVLSVWRGYTDEAAFVFAETEGEPHNTITPIARCRDGVYELDLVLRNNITTKEHPMGLYHPHANLHHIKKENIGLIEVMGLAVLPARLKTEMEAVKAEIQKAVKAHPQDQNAAKATVLSALRKDETLKKHADWAETWLSGALSAPAALDEMLQDEIGMVFCQVLEDAGVYKCTEAGREAFGRFLRELGMERI